MTRSPKKGNLTINENFSCQTSRSICKWMPSHVSECFQTAATWTLWWVAAVLKVEVKFEHQMMKVNFSIKFSFFSHYVLVLSFWVHLLWKHDGLKECVCVEAERGEPCPVPVGQREKWFIHVKRKREKNRRDEEREEENREEENRTEGNRREEDRNKQKKEKKREKRREEKREKKDRN